MSDSFNINTEEKFDACSWLIEKCKDTKVIMANFGQFEFNVGWKGIVENFIHSVKNQPINIVYLEERFGQIEIDFTVREKSKEVHVWRQINQLRKVSLSTCVRCGEDGKRQFHGENVTVLCRSCKSKANANGDTGTWLDRY